VLERDGHRIVEATDGQQALDAARRDRPDLVLSDVLMPGMDGFTLCRHLQADPQLRHVPFVFMTGTFADAQYRDFATQVGAVAVLQKPLDARSLRAAIDDALVAGGPSDPTLRLWQFDDAAFHQRHTAAVNARLQQNVVELERTNRELRRSEARSRELLAAVVTSIDKMVEYRDPYTTGHERRVGELAAAIGGELGYEGVLLDALRIGGCLHDVGKFAMPAEILTKPGRLSPVEMALIRTHPQVGYDILSGIEFPWRIAEMAYQHHERLDGSGYPRGLQGTDILLEARILAVADTIEAMSSHRPYRPGFGIERALLEIERQRGVLYDEVAVDACLRLFREGRFQFDSERAATPSGPIPAAVDARKWDSHTCSWPLARVTDERASS
jgi:putative nucleotidyltransferase with HDIG domain